jgi:hypothetical protein
MSTFRFLPTIRLRRRLVILRLTMLNRRAYLNRLIHDPRFLRGLMYSPKRTTLKALRTIPTIPTIIGAMFAIATAFSSGRGNTINDFADRLLGAQMGIWAGK